MTLALPRPVPAEPAGEPRKPLAIALTASLALHGAALGAVLWLSGSAAAPVPVAPQTFAVVMVDAPRDAAGRAPGAAGIAAKAAGTPRDSTTTTGQTAAKVAQKPASHAQDVASKAPPHAHKAVSKAPQEASVTRPKPPPKAPTSVSPPTPAPPQRPPAPRAKTAPIPSEIPAEPPAKSTTKAAAKPAPAAKPVPVATPAAPAPPSRGSSPRSRVAAREPAAPAAEHGAASPSASGASGAAGAAATPPRYGLPGLANPRPAYPWIAREQGEQGRVVVRVAVNAQGKVDRATVARSSGHARLDRAAVAAIARWQFAPARRGGRAVPGTVEVPVRFRLSGG